MSSAAPLQGVRVLDLTRLLPGPWATLVLADLGADVVKVEEPNGGDYLRAMPPAQGEDSALFLALNRGKRSIALDLKVEADRAVFLELAGQADVVIESFRPGVMARLGLGWDVLHKAFPRLVLCSISGFGQTGVYAKRAGHDLDYLALSGLLGLTGERQRAPAMPNAQIADIAGGGLGAVSGLLAALFDRERTGKGRWVDVSMTEGALGTLHMALAPHLQGVGSPPRRGEGLLSGELARYGIYHTKDGRHLAVAALEPKFWEGFCALIQRPDLVVDGFGDAGAQARVRRELEKLVGEHTLEEWGERLEGADVCVEPVLDAEELVGHPVHVARGTFVEGPQGMTQRTPIRFADEDLSPALSPAPALGADAAAVLRDWLGR